MYNSELSFSVYRLLFIFLMAAHSDMALSSTTYKIVKIECLPRPEYINNTVCRLQALNWYRTYANMDCDIVKPLTNVSIFLRNNANLYNPFIVNVTHNLCDILGKKYFPGYTTIVMSILKPVSNVNHTCPYTDHLMVRNLYIEEKFIPMEPPFGLYKGVFRFLQGYPYEEIGTVILYAEVKERKQAWSRRKHNNNSQ